MTGGIDEGAAVEEGIGGARATASASVGTEVEPTMAVRNVAVASELEGVPTTRGGSGKIQVTEASIKETLKGSNMKTTQGNVSLSMVKRYVEMLEAGSTVPPLKVAEGNIIVDGNHRYVSGRVAGVDPQTVKGTMSPSQAARVVPVSDTKIDPSDWGGH